MALNKKSQALLKQIITDIVKVGVTKEPDHITQELMDKAMFALNNCSKRYIKVPTIDPSILKVGDVVYADVSKSFMAAIQWHKIKITHIRGSVIFYVDVTAKSKDEEYLDMLSFTANNLYEIIHFSDLNPKYYIPMCDCPKTKIINIYKK